ncbi:MAG: FtsW/RodA/SpoVE family cell cycle protein [Kineosporiaceae bacterium]|nr:FtsW/RodA/SpoVE family cell cycle protein [Kineosporiaceae bacterium]
MVVVAPVITRTRRNVELVLLLVALAIGLGAYALVGIAEKGTIPADMATYGGAMALLALAVHVVLRVRAAYADPVILPIVTVLNGLGLVMIHRIDLAKGREVGESLALRQLIWTTLGVAAAIVVLMILRDHRGLSRYTYTAMAGAIALLLLPLVPFVGREINGARIWIRLGPMSFQPGEIAKIALAVFFAGYLVIARDSLSLVGRKVLGLQLPRARDLGPILVVWMVSLGVLVFQRDLGTSLLFFGLFVALLYVATERTSWIVIGMGLFVGGAFTASLAFSHVGRRVDAWLHTFDPSVSAYQLQQGLFGMASGGLLGTGLGQGRPDIVPFSESDFIIASIGEELGLTGLFAVLTLYLVLVERGLRTAIGVRDGFGKLLSAGLAFSLGLQVFVVVGGVTRVIPLTGLTTPFLAYGGSSLLSNWIIAALLLRISDSARRPRAASPDTAPTEVVPA